MRKVYKIYEIDTIDVNAQVNIGDYGYGATTIYPTVLRELYQPGWEEEDTFDTLVEAEKYIEDNLIHQYDGTKYTILTEYYYEI